MKKNKIFILLCFCLVLTLTLAGTTKVSAASDPALAPSDWAFEESSVPLHDALLGDFPIIDSDGDGFISIGEANAYTGDIYLYTRSDVTGTLNGLEHFISVEMIDIYQTSLSGEIPDGLGNLTNLFALGLRENQLSGAIPATLGNLSGLWIFSLSGNQLSGEIPTELGDLPNLAYLSLDNNQLSGNIPPELGGLSNLQGLLLNSNHLSGAIPAELGNMSNLGTLYLGHNQLSGTIPTELGNASNLYEMDLSYNELSGEIPAELGNISNLATLNLDHNQLSGTIPTELGNASNLYDVNLSYNELSGAVPAEFRNLSKLQNLNLSVNQLSSLDTETYIFLTGVCTANIKAQHIQEVLPEGEVNREYTFDSLPVFTQVPTYGDTSTIRFVLFKPDGSEVVITPNIVNGEIVIDASELDQEGMYTFSARIEEGLLHFSHYMSFFTLYDHSEVDVDITVKKELRGKELEPKQFEFELKEDPNHHESDRDRPHRPHRPGEHGGSGHSDDGGEVNIDFLNSYNGTSDSDGEEVIATATNDADGNVVFKVTGLTPGTYRYIITERAGTDPNITYDGREIHVEIYIDSSGAVEITYRDADGNIIEEPTFINEYHQPVDTEQPSEQAPPSTERVRKIPKTGAFLSSVIGIGLIGAGAVLFKKGKMK